MRECCSCLRERERGKNLMRKKEYHTQTYREKESQRYRNKKRQRHREKQRAAESTERSRERQRE